MNTQQAIDLINEYYSLCRKHNLKFPWNYQGLIANPKNIKVHIVIKSIKEIKQTYERSNQGGKLLKIKKPKKRKEKKVAAKSTKKKPVKKEIHITIVTLKRSETEVKKKKGKSKKNYKARKTKNVKPRKWKRRRLRIFPGGISRQ